jgi:hypothetical protein
MPPLVGTAPRKRTKWQVILNWAEIELAERGSLSQSRKEKLLYEL